jgi:hypothetical protein
MTPNQSAARRPLPPNPALRQLGERQCVADELHDVVIQKFPTVPDKVIAVLTACAVDWLTAAGDTVTVSALRPLVLEALELRLDA